MVTENYEMALEKERVVLDDLEDLLIDVERRLTLAITKINTVGLQQGDAIAFQNAVAARAEIKRTLDAAGVIYRELLTDYTVSLAIASLDANQLLPDNFDANPADRIDRALSGVFDQVTHVFGKASNILRRGIIRSSIGGESTSAMISQLQHQMKLTRDYSTTLAVTALHSASRATTVETAEDTEFDFVYIYSGPDDTVTRPFCRFYGFPSGLKSKVAYTRAALKALSKDPNQKKQPGGKAGDVAAYGGGYNCRHNWNAIPMFMAQEQKYTIRGPLDVRDLILKGGSSVIKT
jgi:hypothetical protein